MAAELLDHARNFRNPFKIDTFRIFVKTHRAMLFPAFQVQLALQRKFLGTAFWENNANRRMEICNGKYVSVGTFISEVSHLKLLFYSIGLLTYSRLYKTYRAYLFLASSLPLERKRHCSH